MKSNNEIKRPFFISQPTEPFLDSQKLLIDIESNWPKAPTEQQLLPSSNEISLEEFMPITTSLSLLPDRTSQIFPVPVYSKPLPDSCDASKKPPRPPQGPVTRHFARDPQL